MATEEIHTYCPMCIAQCGVVAMVEDGRFTKVTPDSEHPNGGICIKGYAAPEIVYSPDRLRHPLKRTRPKGDPDPGWAEISWDEALETVASRLVVSLLDKSLGVGGLRQISRYGDDFAVCLARNLGRRCFQRLPATRADCDIDTLASQGKGDRLADTDARSGDECRLAVHLEIHAASRRLNTAMKTYQGQPASTLVSIDAA